MDSEQPGKPGGGLPDGLLPTTHWSIVSQARRESASALNSLFTAYRNPLLVWLRCRGHKPEDAEDLVQGFFANLMRRDFLSHVSRDRGRFRTFLLTSLQRYVLDDVDRRNAGKRGGGRPVESLQETDEDGRLVHDRGDSHTTPDLDYDRAWAISVLANATHRLARECASSGHQVLFEALEPVMLADETASPYREIGQRLNMSEGAVKTAAHRIRARLKGLIRDEIMQTVATEQEFELELRYLISLFGRPGGGGV